MTKKEFIESMTAVLQMENFTSGIATEAARTIVTEAPTKRTTEIAVTYLSIVEDFNASIDALLEEVIEYGKNTL